MLDDPPANPEQPLCPHCGVQIAPPDPAAATTNCPHCQGEVTLVCREAEQPIVDDTEPPEHPDAAPEEQLDGMRIRQRIIMRRAAIRARSYCLIALIACIVIGVQLADNAYRALHQGFWRPALWLILALLCVRGATYFAGRMAYYSREAQPPPEDAPATPPDFTPLSDGSQHLKALHDMNRTPPPPDKP